MKVTIVTTAHWEGDPRLNRHKAYLEDAGHEVELRSLQSLPRMKATWAAIRLILRRTADDAVLIPDPEMFALGSLAARIAGKRPIIDIHEDYRLVSAGRSWVPRGMGPLVSIGARLAVATGRLLAWRVVVAAGHLARSGDHVVLNIPRPEDWRIVPQRPSAQVVYVGDVTLPRGAAEMVELAQMLPKSIRMLVVGRVSPEAASVIGHRPESLALAGRLPHDEAWQMAAGSVAGLCLLRPLPAYAEAVATKIWEYMASAIPPLVTDLPGQRRVVSQIDPGLVGTSVRAIADMAIRLSSDPELRKTLGARAREVYMQAWEDSRPDVVLQDAVVP